VLLLANVMVPENSWTKGDLEQRFPQRLRVYGHWATRWKQLIEL